VWDPLLEPGLPLLSGPRAALRGFAQELAHHALHSRPGHVLWCDGDHGFDPYEFAELNLERGFQADDGAGRLLVKRCMTPFQWDSVLTDHLDQKLHEVTASLVVVAPYDRLWSTDELSDWEQEDYVRHSLKHLKGLARRLRIPVLLFADMSRWWQTHPVLAQATQQAATARWSVERLPGRWRATRSDGAAFDPALRRRVTLLDWTPPLLPPLPIAAEPAQGQPAQTPVPLSTPPRHHAWRRRPLKPGRIMGFGSTT